MAIQIWNSSDFLGRAEEDGPQKVMALKLLQWGNFGHFFDKWAQTLIFASPFILGQSLLVAPNMWNQ